MSVQLLQINQVARTGMLSASEAGMSINANTWPKSKHVADVLLRDSSSDKDRKNGKRKRKMLVVKRLQKNLNNARIVTGSNRKVRSFIPIAWLESSACTQPNMMCCGQFALKFSSVMTLNNYLLLFQPKGNELTGSLSHRVKCFGGI